MDKKVQDRINKLIEGNEKIVKLYDHDTSYTVGFNHYDTWIHNPLYSECYRFEVVPEEYYKEDFLDSSFVKSKWDEPFAGLYFRDFKDKNNSDKIYAVGVNDEVIILYRYSAEELTREGWDDTSEIVLASCLDEEIDLEVLTPYLSQDDIYEVISGYYEYCIMYKSKMLKFKK
jgi:hypothetical protein